MMKEKMKVNTAMEIELIPFIEAVTKFVHLRNKKQGSLIMHALETFRLIPNANSASFFIINKETLKFSHKLTTPNEYKENNSVLFNELIECGVVTKIIKSCTSILYPELEQSSSERMDNRSQSSRDVYQLNRIMIIPVEFRNDDIGMIIVTFSYFNKTVSSVLLHLSQLYANLLGLLLDNNLLTKYLEQTKNILEQKVAKRTMKPVRSERELWESVPSEKAILDSVHSAVLVIDATTGIIVRANLLAMEMIGITETELIESNYREYLDYNKICEIGKHSEKFKNFESKLKRKDGTIVPIIRTISFITIRNEYYRIESFFDISNRKKIEEKLQNHYKQLEIKLKERTKDLEILIEQLKNEVSKRTKLEKQFEKSLAKEKELSEMKTRFVSMISHEIKTPLTIIRTAAQLMEKFGNKLSRIENEELLEKIIKSVDWMKDFIDNVIFIGSADSDALKLSPDSINLKELCNSVISDIKFTIGKQRNIGYIFEGIETFITDGKLLKHILNNLLTNAIKYSPEDKPVDLIVKTTSRKTVISIKDYGIGIPESEQKRIFDVFYRANNVGSISGTGLGMAVVLRSLELLNGKLDVSSIINQGSTFKITIPSLKEASKVFEAQ